MGKKLISIAIILLLSIGSAQASIFSDIFNFIISPSNPAPQQPTPTYPSQVSPVQIENKDDFKAFLDALTVLNTNANIQELNAVMGEYGVKTVKVRVSDYKETFYVVYGQGIVADYPIPTYDREIVLTSSQIKRISEYLYDGKLDSFDRWMIYAIYKMG